MNKELGQRLKDIRGAQSQDAMSKLLGIPQTTWSNYEKGRNKPDLALIDKICTDFGVSLEWLLFGKGEKDAIPLLEHSSACPQCAELQRQLAVTNERLFKAMEENGNLKEEIGKLNIELVYLKNAQRSPAADQTPPMASAS